MSVSQAWGMMSGSVGTLTTIAIADGMCCVVLCAVFFLLLHCCCVLHEMVVTFRFSHQREYVNYFKEFPFPSFLDPVHCF